MAGRSNELAGQAVQMIGWVAAAALARKLVPIVWVAATGKPDIDDPADPDVDTRDAIVYAVLTAVAVSVGRTLVNRQATALKQRGSTATKAVAST